MPRALMHSPALDLKAISEASIQLQTLTARLPPDAVQAFANEVVDRLSRNLRGSDRIAIPVSTELIERLCEALVSNDPHAGARMISEIRADGSTVPDIYTLYLAAAARRLGEKWVSDHLTFMEVTIGSSRILAIMRGLRDCLRVRRAIVERMALFAAVPGEHHTIGITMASDLFRRDGWEIEMLVGLGHEEILEKINASEALVVGLSAHGAQSLGALVRLIAGIRVVDPSVYIIVSGHIVEEAKDLIALTGADSLAADIPEALAEAKRLFDLANA